MAQWHMKPTTKKTGGLKKRYSKKKKYQMGRDFLPTSIGKSKVRETRGLGGNLKRVVFSAEFANIMVKGKAQKAKIISVSNNPADSQFIRRNIITKGAIIQTDLGKARVTSRPGQEGIINAVLVEEKK